MGHRSPSYLATPVPLLLRFSLLRFSLLLSLLLSACTGTSEPRPPTLLVVGTQLAGDPNLLLLEDVTATAPAGDPRLVPLPSSARPLQAPAIAFDLEDRALTRPGLWVLGREVANVGGTPAVSSYLQRFEVEDIDPLAPTGFAEDVSARVTLTEPGGGGVLDGLSLTSPFTCPSAVQVDREGTLAAVLDDPAACGASDHPELWLVPLPPGSDPEDTPRTLQGTNDLAPLPPYLDQRPDAQVLYFLVDAINATHVFTDELDGTPSSRDPALAVPEPASELIDLAGAGDTLVVLAREDLLSIDLLEPGAAGRAATTVDALSLVTDPGGAVSELLVLSESRTAFHTEPQDASPDTTQRPLVAASIDPVTRFAYGVADGNVTILDLLTGADSGLTFRAHVEPMDEIVLPDAIPAGLPGASELKVGAIAWLRATPAALAP